MQIDSSNQSSSGSQMSATRNPITRASKKRESIHKSMLKFKRKQRISLNARSKDRIIRDNMFLKQLSPHKKQTNSIRCIQESLLEADNECILLEDTPEIIVIDDDEEKEETTLKETTNIQTNKSRENSVRKKANKRRKITVKLTPKESNMKRDLSVADSQDVVSIVEILPRNISSGSTNSAQESEGIASTDNHEPSAHITPDTAQKESKNGIQESISNGSQAEESILYFEDVTAAVNVSRNEIPLYDVTFDRKDIFRPTSVDDVVFVSSTPNAAPKKRNNKRILDESVVFVSEEPAPVINTDFLSFDTHDKQLLSSPKYFKLLPLRVRQLQLNDGPPIKKSKNSKCPPITPENKSKKNADLFTASEKKKNAIYNSNTYNPHANDPSPGKRMVILDGCNIAYGHLCGTGFSAKGIEIAIEYFEKMGHEVKAVVPQNRLKRSKSTDPELLEKLHRMGKIVFTPCKQLPGMSAISYDDRFILQLAVEFDAAIVSNDNYRDLLNENPAFKKIIECRVIGYTWCNDLFMLPKDPYGRNGPSLSVILNRV